jgi:hypothetical protein
VSEARVEHTLSRLTEMEDKLMETLPPQQRLQTQTQELPRTKLESKEIADMQEEVRTVGLTNEKGKTSWSTDSAMSLIWQMCVRLGRTREINRSGWTLGGKPSQFDGRKSW